MLKKHSRRNLYLEEYYMKYAVVSVIGALFLAGCAAKEQRELTGVSTGSLDVINSVKISTDKGQAYALAQAKEGCGRSKKVPILTNTEEKSYSKFVVYSYDCK